MTKEAEALKEELEEQGLLVNDGDELTPEKLLRLAEVGIEQIVEQGKETDAKIDAQHQLDCWSYAPIDKLKLSMDNKWLAIAELTTEVIRKAKIQCPELWDKTFVLLDAIDDDFLDKKEKLIDYNMWVMFVTERIIPYFLAYCGVIKAVNGKINVDMDILADRIKWFTAK